MLVDTSVWIPWLQGRQTPATEQLDRLLDEADALLAPVILQELLQGARNEAAMRQLRDEFGDQPMLRAGDSTYVLGGELYARCRWQGITIRSPHDCLIAALAIEHDVDILHNDRDFLHIATITPTLRLWHPT